MCDELLEAVPPLTAAQYRRLWLDAEDKLGVIAESLAEVLGWQTTHEEPLPDALQLAELAAVRLGDTVPCRRPQRRRMKTRTGQGQNYVLN